MIDVDVTYRAGSFNLCASFEASGKATALFGRSGSGKTTLANLISGLETPESGKIIVAGQNVYDSSKSLDIPAENRQIGYVFQDGRLFPHMTVSKNLTYGDNSKTRTNLPYSTEEIISLLDIGSILHRLPKNLSGGEKQRVAIARTILSYPRFLMMDEPLAALGDDHKSEILPFISRLKETLDLPVLYISHTVSEVLELTDTMVVLSNGQISAVGPTEEVISQLGHADLENGDIGSVLTGQIIEHDSVNGLDTISTPAGKLHIGRTGREIGQSLRIQIRSRDVALATEMPQNLSILNVFEGRILTIENTGKDHEVTVTLDAGGGLKATITRRSANVLSLKEGMTIYALIKTVAIN